MASINQPIEVSERESEINESISPCNPPNFESAVTIKAGNQTPSLKDNEIETEIVEPCEKLRIVFSDFLFWIKGIVEDLRLRYGYGSIERTRAYQVWPGKNVFFFRGRLICGPDPRGLVLTTVSIILSSWIFAIYVGGDDLPKHSCLIITFSMILTVIVLANLIMVSGTDPGIIPRNDQASTDEEVGSSNGTRKNRVVVNGVELKLKYCRICKIFRPPRSCHCAICDNCVQKFDHHCPWTGQCIGLRNYRLYLMFISSALVFFIYIFAFSCRRIDHRMSETGAGLLGMMKDCPETLALASFSFAAIWFLGGLASVHLYLITINQTAYENFRQRYIGSINSFDKGILSNIKEVLFSPWPPSGVDFRAEVSPNYVQRL